MGGRQPKITDLAKSLSLSINVGYKFRWTSLTIRRYLVNSLKTSALCLPIACEAASKRPPSLSPAFVFYFTRTSSGVCWVYGNCGSPTGLLGSLRLRASCAQSSFCAARSEAAVVGDSKCTERMETLG